jgi:hypothetical protein
VKSLCVATFVSFLVLVTGTLLGQESSNYVHGPEVNLTNHSSGQNVRNGFTGSSNVRSLLVDPHNNFYVVWDDFRGGIGTSISADIRKMDGSRLLTCQTT